MEAFGFFADGEWENFSKMFSTEELDFTQQFLYQCNSFPQQHGDQGLHFINPSSFFPTSEANVSLDGINESLFYSSNSLNSDLQNLSQDISFGCKGSSGVFIPTATHETAAYVFRDSTHSPMTNDVSMSMDFCIMDEKKIGLHGPAFPDSAREETAPTTQYMSGNKSGELDNGQPATGVVPAKELQLKRKFDVPALHNGEDNKVNVNSADNTKKKPRVSRYAQKANKKNAQSKNQSLSPKGNEGEESNGGSDGQSSSSYSSEEDNASQETDTNGGATSDSKASALNLNGKPRASRGSATDPQSIYARKRRERINERLKILQNLVPNGTKVDISTMLEEAVHYVKFLQLQIKLLSSDDLWMYAPIAYNGIDIIWYIESPTATAYALISEQTCCLSRDPLLK